jgi:hypothetical protein
MTGLFWSILDKIYTIFLEARHHRAVKNSKIIAIDDDQRRFVHFARQKRSEVSKPSETITIQSCRFRAMRPNAEFPYCLRVQKVLFGID